MGERAPHLVAREGVANHDADWSKQMFGMVVVFLIGTFLYFYAVIGGPPGLVAALSEAPLGGIASLFILPGMFIVVITGVVLPIMVERNFVDFRERRYITYAYDPTQKTPPSDLPAPAVSVLRGREVTDRTLGAIVVEMYQRGVLRVRPAARTVGDSPSPDNEYDFRLFVEGQPRYEWERALCDAMQGKEVTHEWIKEALTSRRSVIGKQLGRLLKERGLFNSNPMTGIPWLWCIRFTGIALIVCGLVASFAGAVAADWPPVDIAGLFLFSSMMALFYALILLRDRRRMKLADKSKPNSAGHDEIMQWLAFRTTMWEQDAPTGEDRDRSYPYLSYAFALGVDKPWMYSRATGARPPDMGMASPAVNRPEGDFRLFRPADTFFFAWIASDYVGSSMAQGSDFSGSGGSDFDIDFDI